MMPRLSLALLGLLTACAGDTVTTGASLTASTTADPAPTTTATTATTADPATTTSTAPSGTATTDLTEPVDPVSPSTDTTTGAPDATTADPATTGFVDDECTCATGNDEIFVLSDDAELWTYAPLTDAFTFRADVACPGAAKPFSMAVDRRGVAWILYSSDGVVRTFDPADPGSCALAGVFVDDPTFKYFGLTFAPAAPLAACDRLFLFNYSGSGPFKEGPGIGALGVFDPYADVPQVTALGPTDYDGGELAGTGDARLFAFAGADPAKLIEYDQTTAGPLSVLPLTGLRKTRASAFAFHGGDAWFFTEGVEATCYPCLDTTCPAEFAACQADPTCADALACSLALGDVQDQCGGLMGPDMLECAFATCSSACYPAADDTVSKVTRLDHDDSDGAGQVLTLVNPAAPIRIVGAAASTCAPYVPQ
jgi:hypothetical protein